MSTADEVAILVFVATAVQAYFTWWAAALQRRNFEEESTRRLNERVSRQAEQRRDATAATMMAWRLSISETVRLSTLIGRYLQLPNPDFAAAMGLLDAREFKVARPAEFTRNMALISPAAADIASALVSIADNFAFRVDNLIRVTQGMSTGLATDRIRQLNTASAMLKPLLEAMRTEAEDLKLLIEDAAYECAPPVSVRRNFKRRPTSKWAAMQFTLLEQQGLARVQQREPSK